MHLVILENSAQIGEYASDLILRRLTAGKLRNLGVATGSSPLSIYKALESRWVPGLAALNAFALDEYVGLPPQHPESYHSVIDREVTRRLRLDPGRVHVPDGYASDLAAACEDFEA